MGFLVNAVRRQVHAAYAVAVLALIRGASPLARSALPPLNASSACGVHPTPPSYCVYTPLAWRAPLTSSLPGPMCALCLVSRSFHLVYLSCTHVLHNPHDPHVQPTHPYGCHRAMWILCDDARMGMQWGCAVVASFKHTLHVIIKQHSHT